MITNYNNDVLLYFPKQTSFCLQKKMRYLNYFTINKNFGIVINNSLFAYTVIFHFSQKRICSKTVLDSPYTLLLRSKLDNLKFSI